MKRTSAVFIPQTFLRRIPMITLHFCEYNRFNQDYDTIFRPGGSGDYLFLLLKTPMKIYLQEELIITKENACLLFTPQTPQHYQAVKRFCNSYLHFSSDLSPARQYGFPENEIFYPSNPAEIDSFIRSVQMEYFSLAEYRDEYIHCLISQMFISISRDLLHRADRKEDGENLYLLFQNLRRKMLSNCQEEWTIERLCQEVNLEKSQFYVYYHHFFSTTPKTDLLHVRMEKAKSLLSNEALQVQEAARLCGFTNLQHFTRYFRKYCGCSPREYGLSCKQKEEPVPGSSQ